MSRIFAVLTSDPNLLGCELSRSEEACSWADPVAGIGSYGHGDVLLLEAKGEAATRPPSRLWRSGRGAGSPALLHWSGEREGRSTGAFDGRVPPWRFRQWLFAQGGRLPESADARAKVLRSLPEFLRRQVPALSDGEVAFGIFLRKLHEAGALEDRPFFSDSAAKVMGATVRVLMDLYAQVASGPPAVSLVASNGTLLVAARLGEERLWYRKTEGLEGCSACVPGPGAADASAVLHRRLRSVVIASKVELPDGWTSLPPQSVLTVDGKLEPVLGSL